MGTINRANNYRRNQSYKTRDTINIKTANNIVKARGTRNTSLITTQKENIRMVKKSSTVNTKVEKTQEEYDLDKLIYRLKNIRLIEVYKFALRYDILAIVAITGLYSMRSFGILHTTVFSMLLYSNYKIILHWVYSINPMKFNRRTTEQKLDEHIQLIFITFIMILMTTCMTGNLDSVVESLANEIQTFRSEVIEIINTIQK